MNQPDLFPCDPLPIPGTIQVRFKGPVYEPKHDLRRLTGQILRVWETMRTGQWRTLREIADLTGDPEASCSAQLRHLRKPRFGGHRVEKRSRGDRKAGLWEYRLIVKFHGHLDQNRS